MKLFYICFVCTGLLSKRSYRIIKGFAVPDNSVNHKFSVKVQMYYGKADNFCSGTLISPSFVLTAAHCVYIQGKTKWKYIKVLQHDPISKKDYFFDVQNIIAHPQFAENGPVLINDIALLKLKVPVINAKNFACLPTNDNDEFVGANATATGWGLTEVITDMNQKPTKVLKSATLKVLSNPVCTDVFDKLINEKMHPDAPHVFVKITHATICADGQIFNSQTCRGDSGGKYRKF